MSSSKAVCSLYPFLERGGPDEAWVWRYIDKGCTPDVVESFNKAVFKHYCITQAESYKLVLKDRAEFKKFNQNTVTILGSEQAEGSISLLHVKNEIDFRDRDSALAKRAEEYVDSDGGGSSSSSSASRPKQKKQKKKKKFAGAAAYIMDKEAKRQKMTAVTERFLKMELDMALSERYNCYSVYDTQKMILALTSRSVLKLLRDLTKIRKSREKMRTGGAGRGRSAAGAAKKHSRIRRKRKNVSMAPPAPSRSGNAGRYSGFGGRSKQSLRRQSDLYSSHRIAEEAFYFTGGGSGGGGGGGELGFEQLCLREKTLATLAADHYEYDGALDFLNSPGVERAAATARQYAAMEDSQRAACGAHDDLYPSGSAVSSDSDRSSATARHRPSKVAQDAAEWVRWRLASANLEFKCTFAPLEHTATAEELDDMLLGMTREIMFGNDLDDCYVNIKNMYYYYCRVHSEQGSSSGSSLAGDCRMDMLESSTRDLAISCFQAVVAKLQKMSAMMAHRGMLGEELQALNEKNYSIRKSQWQRREEARRPDGETFVETRRIVDIERVERNATRISLSDPSPPVPNHPNHHPNHNHHHQQQNQLEVQNFTMVEAADGSTTVPMSADRILVVKRMAFFRTLFDYLNVGVHMVLQASFAQGMSQKLGDVAENGYMAIEDSPEHDQQLDQLRSLLDEYQSNTMTDENKPIHDMIDFLLSECAVLGLVKDGESVFEPKKVVNRMGKVVHTLSYDHMCTIKELPYKLINKDVHRKVWNTLVSEPHSKVSNYFFNSNDHQLPRMRKDRGWHSFMNGVYCSDNDTFYTHAEARRHMKPGTCALKFHELDFPVDELRAIGDDPMAIPTPNLDRIFRSQRFSKEMVYWHFVMLGRMLFKTNDKDKWQIMPFFSGTAGTGKSTMLQVIAMFFDQSDIEQVTDKNEQIFGLQGFLKAKIWLGYDLSDAFDMPQAIWQSLVSGEPVSVKVKNKGAVNEAIRAHGAACGNGHLPFKDNAGSVTRRTVVFKYMYAVPDKEKDMNLIAKIKANLPYIMVKAVKIYLKTTSENKDRSFWSIAPSDFYMSSRELREQTNRIVEFMNSQYVIVAGGMKCTFEDFKTAFMKFCKENEYRNNRLENSSMNEIFTKRNCTLQKRTITDPGGYTTEQKIILGMTLREPAAEEAGSASGSASGGRSAGSSSQSFSSSSSGSAFSSSGSASSSSSSSSSAAPSSSPPSSRAEDLMDACDEEAGLAQDLDDMLAGEQEDDANLFSSMME